MSIDDEVKKIIESMPPDAQAQLKDAFARSETEDDFLALTLIGPCPKCGNELTKNDYDDAEDAEEDEMNPTIGICPECDHRWCIECGLPVSEGDCPHWKAYDDYCKEHNIDEDDIEQYALWLDSWVESRSGQSDSSERE